MICEVVNDGGFGYRRAARDCGVNININKAVRCYLYNEGLFLVDMWCSEHMEKVKAHSGEIDGSIMISWKLYG